MMITAQSRSITLEGICTESKVAMASHVTLMQNADGSSPVFLSADIKEDAPADGFNAPSVYLAFIRERVPLALGARFRVTITQLTEED